MTKKNLSRHNKFKQSTTYTFGSHFSFTKIKYIYPYFSKFSHNLSRSCENISGLLKKKKKKNTSNPTNKTKNIKAVHDHISK